MAGIAFLPRESKVRPGVYVRTINVGGPAVPGVQRGVVGMLRASNWGPLNTATLVSTPDQARILFNEPDTGPIMQAFAGGADGVMVARVGTSGAAATVNIMDVAPAIGVTLAAKWLGTLGNSLKFTVRDHITDATKKQLLIYNGTQLVQTVDFAKAPAGSTESDALVAALALTGSDYVTATRGVGAGATIPNVSSVSLASGTNPTTSASEYTAGMSVLEPLTIQWNVIAADSNDASIQASIGTYVSRIRGDGKRVMAVVAEPTSVALSTRMTNAAGFNNYAVVYVANGFVDSSGGLVEGYPAAARLAGMIAASAYNESLTHRPVANAANVIGGLTGSQIDTAINSGAVVFSLNGAGQVQVEYGITTLVTLSGNIDGGWKKIRRVLTRDTLVDRCALLTEGMIGNVPNNSIGQSQVKDAILTVINGMVAEGGLRPGGTVDLDPANDPTSDSAWFIIQVDDLDAIEKLYETFGLRLNP